MLCRGQRKQESAEYKRSFPSAVLTPQSSQLWSSSAFTARHTACFLAFSVATYWFCLPTLRPLTRPSVARRHRPAGFDRKLSRRPLHHTRQECGPALEYFFLGRELSLSCVCFSCFLSAFSIRAMSPLIWGRCSRIRLKVWRRFSGLSPVSRKA